MADYVIIGGHGKIALLTAPLLVEQGHTVVSVVRNPDHVAEVEAAGARAVVLDVEQATGTELEKLFVGKDAVVWSAGAGGGNPARTYAVDRDAAKLSMDAAAQAGVRRYVMVSYLGADQDHGVPADSSFFPYAEAKADADAHLRASDLDWTILGPGALTTAEPSGTVTVHADNGRSTTLRDTSRANVAQMIVAALDSPASIGRTIAFTDGDTPISEAVGRA